jgi:phytoene dehydrogenase-like protein
MAHEGEAIAIVGGGLAGLRAAYTLEQLGYSPVIFEASERIGGRVKSDHLDGFTLDHGFQVILSSYSEIFSLLPKKEFELSYFPSGAMIQHHGEWISLLNPIRDPEKMVFGKEPFFFDFLKLSKLYLKQKLQSEQRLTPDPQPRSTWDLLKEIGLSDPFIEEALRPFFAAIFFDPDLFTSSFAFQRILPFFIEGKVGLAKKGIETLPLGLAKKLTKTKIHLHVRIEKIEKGKLYTESKEEIETDWIILATDLNSTRTFIPTLVGRETKSMTCLYFAIEEGVIEPAPFLYLEGDRKKPINNFCFNSLVQLSYAPAGKLLLSAVVINPTWQKNPLLQQAVIEQLCAYFNTAANKWEHIKTYAISHALPDQSRPPFYHGKYCFDREKRIYLCGEAVDPPSFNDALASGRRVAEVLHDAICNQKISR